MRPITRVPSIGVRVPSLTALKTLPAASEASMALVHTWKGKDNWLILHWRRYAVHTKPQGNAVTIQVLSIWHVWVNASAWPSRRLSIAMVALLREPLGRPAFPSENLPSVFLPFFISNDNINIAYFEVFVQKFKCCSCSWA